MTLIFCTVGIEVIIILTSVESQVGLRIETNHVTVATGPFSGSLIWNLREHRGVLTRPHLLNTHFNVLFTSVNFIVFGIYRWRHYSFGSHTHTHTSLGYYTHTHSCYLLLQSSTSLISYCWRLSLILIYKSAWFVRLNQRNSVCNHFHCWVGKSTPRSRRIKPLSTPLGQHWRSHAQHHRSAIFITDSYTTLLLWHTLTFLESRRKEPHTMRLKRKDGSFTRFLFLSTVAAAVVCLTSLVITTVHHQRPTYVAVFSSNETQHSMLRTGKTIEATPTNTDTS